MQKAVLSGWFVYDVVNDGWGDRFTVEDDDGMPFLLDVLKHFHGRPVRITVEVDDTLKPDYSQTAYVYEKLGLTVGNCRSARDRQRAELLKTP
jgi:hypothetical protein